MTNQQHPITPPPELIEKWHSTSPLDRSVTVATQAARWGADQELEACCKLFESNSVCGTKFQRRSSVRDLRDKRRPKPPSLKEQLIKALDRVPGPGADFSYLCQWSKEESESLINAIRRALEQLDD